MSSGRWLTSKQTARLLGVSEASVKRWADGGALPSEKTVGGHRRFRPESIALFQRAGGLGDERRTRAADDDSGGAKTKRRQAAALSKAAKAKSAVAPQTLFEALVAGRAGEASALLVNAYLHGHSLAALFDGALARAMRRVGTLWYEGELTIAQEHLATRTALTVLHTLRGVIELPEEHGLFALCCGVEGDFHELPVQCAQMLLEGTGWRVLSLGPNTPFSALAEVSAQQPPQLVCVASTVLGNMDRAAREYEEFARIVRGAKAAVVLGGAGFADATIRKRFPAALHADTFQQLAKFAAAVVSARRLPE